MWGVYYGPQACQTPTRPPRKGPSQAPDTCRVAALETSKYACPGTQVEFVSVAEKQTLSKQSLFLGLGNKLHYPGLGLFPAWGN